MTTRQTGVRRLRASAVVGVLTSIAMLTAACTGASGAAGTTDAAALLSTAQAVGPGSSVASTPESGPSISTAAEASATDVPAVDASASSEASPSEQAPSPATTPVAPPSAGDVSQTVADVEQTTLPPASFQQGIEVGAQLVVTVDRVQKVDATGRGVGEVSGPALSYSVSVRNDGSSPVDLGAVTVNAADESGTPFSPIEGDPTQPFSGSVEPGQTTSATYVFSLPADFTGSTTLSFSSAAGTPIALFTGDAS